MKKCCTCKTEKDESNFGIDNKQIDKLNKVCFECRKKWRQANKLQIAAKRKLRLPFTRNAKRIYDIQYRKHNSEKIRQYKRNWEQKTKDSPLHKIKRNLRRRINHVIKDGYKSDSTLNLLGCSFGEFKIYIESKWSPGMNWDNYGLGENKWHIDHVRPCCDFDLTQESEQRKCFHYSNLQPLWEKDNLRKSYIFNGKNCRIK